MNLLFVSRCTVLNGRFYFLFLLHSLSRSFWHHSEKMFVENEALRAVINHYISIRKQFKLWFSPTVRPIRYIIILFYVKVNFESRLITVELYLEFLLETFKPFPLTLCYHSLNRCRFDIYFFYIEIQI